MLIYFEITNISKYPIEWKWRIQNPCSVDEKNGFSQIKGHIKMGYQRGMEGLDQPRAGDSFKAGLG